MVALHEFGITSERGFLPESDPALITGDAQFDSTVGRTAQALPKLLTTGRVREAVHDLPELDAEDLLAALDGPRAVNAVMRAYAFLAHAYVWGGPGGPATGLPRNLAVPFAGVASHLGRPPILSYASYALENWTRIDSEGPVEIGNVVLLQNFLGGLDEDWFILVHIDIEARAAPAIAALPGLLDAAGKGDEDAVAVGLEAVAGALEVMQTTLERMPEGCDPYIYYRRVRPFIHGWKDNPSLPDGLIYEGVGRFQGAPQAFRGETGAQSAIIPTLDALLGIEHEPDKLRTYLAEMRTYMPPRHRAFLEAMEDSGGVRAMAEQAGTRVRDAYNACVEGMHRFRAKHLEYAAQYIYRQAETGDNPVAVGTGGTPFMPYLKKHRDESARYKVS